MTADPIQRLRELMEGHRAAVIARQSMEDDDAQRHEDACDMEDEAEKELGNALRNLAPALVVIAQTMRDIAEQDCTYGDNCPTFGTRHGQCTGCQAREALAALDGNGNQ